MRLDLDTTRRVEQLDLKNKLADMEEQHAALVTAAQKMVRALHGGAFIIPNGGNRRERAIAALDGLLAALGLKAGDLDGLPVPTEEQAEGEEK